uniref:Uncharacterized protein n=1 Tax=Oryza brachyantha TaxID=4533 RepID=J3MRG7_ORYBR
MASRWIKPKPEETKNPKRTCLQDISNKSAKKKEAQGHRCKISGTGLNNLDGQKAFCNGEETVREEVKRYKGLVVRKKNASGHICKEIYSARDLDRIRKKIWTISRFVRVILAQGPC